ncbi:MAG: hypothetical protein A2W11_00485 [Ignavibacteria bacterium RBG_16_35_7]|nr:MAG: hypothetical protein A2W11_00485 [Ignavibacteria bacterium RBG_16_35_7]
MKTKNILWITLVVVLVVLTLFYFLQQKKEPEVIKIGAILPLTGTSKDHGKDAKDGMELLLDKLNNSKTLKYTYKIIYEDDQSLSSNSVTVAQKLINFNKVKIIIGPISSTSTLAIAPIAEKAKVVLLSPSASDPQISKSGDYIFRNSLLALPQGERMAKFCKDDIGRNEVSILYMNDDTGVSYYEAFQNSFLKYGGIIKSVERYEKDRNDFRTQLLKLKLIGAKVIYSPGVPKTLGLIIKQANELGFFPIFLANIGIEGEELIDIAGSSINKNVYFTSVLVKDSFTKEYYKRYGKIPKIAAPLAYDALGIAINVIEKYGYESFLIKNGLYNIKNYDGVTGITSFNNDGDAEKQAILKTIEKGKFNFYKN